MAQGRTEAGTCQRIAPARAGKIQPFEWANSVVQRKAGTAAGGGESGSARRKRGEPGGSPRTCEHDGAHAAAGNDNAFRTADCGSRRRPESLAQFARGNRLDRNLHALTLPEFSPCARI